MTALLTSAYFAPVQWYQKLYRYPQVLIEHCDSYQKQTYRNRCLIATANGVQALTVPVDVRPDGAYISDHGNWRHQHWQALTSAYGDSPFFIYYEDDLRPFFTERWERLYDFNLAICRKMCELLDIHPHLSVTTEYVSSLGNNQSDSVKDGSNHNSCVPAVASDQRSSAQFSILNSCVPTVSAQPSSGFVKDWSNHNSQFSILNSQLKIDFREIIHPKHPQPDPQFEPRRYYQVYEQRHGFLANLSILDLLFNMGPESIFFL